MAKGDKFIVGAIAGAVVGTVAALLLAPKAGKETRKLLKEKASQSGKKASSWGTVFKKKRSGDAEHTGEGATSQHGS